MSVATVERIQAEFASLEVDEQHSLLRKLTLLVSKKAAGDQSELCHELDAMSADPVIQRELKAIDVELEHADLRLSGVKTSVSFLSGR